MDDTQIFDIDRYRTQLDSSTDDEMLGSVWTDSPASILVIEKYRHLAAMRSSLGPYVPVDRFVFGKGESPLRQMTKVNGLPYRPAGVEWPIDREGKPMTFLCQFCFGNSRDHLGMLPGDVLLVFMRTMRAYLVPAIYPLVDPIEDKDSLFFEWYPLDLTNLIEAQDIPEITYEPATIHVRGPSGPGGENLLPLVFPTCFGVRYRTCDFVDEQRAIESLDQVVPVGPVPMERSERDCWLQNFAIYPGMKIGGVPLWYRQPMQDIAARYIASFWGVTVAVGVAYPWTNSPKSLSVGEALSKDHYLSLRDGCRLHFFLKEDGTVSWFADWM